MVILWPSVTTTCRYFFLFFFFQKCVKKERKTQKLQITVYEKDPRRSPANHVHDLTCTPTIHTHLRSVKWPRTICERRGHDPELAGIKQSEIVSIVLCRHESQHNPLIALTEIKLNSFHGKT